MGAELKARREDWMPDLPLLGRLLAEHSSLPMAAVEGTGHIVRYVNPAFCRLIGRKSEELVGTPFAQAVPEGEACLPLLDRVHRTGEPEDCQARWSYAMWAVPGAGERPAGVMVLVTDKIEDARFRQQAASMNEALMLAAVRQHELAETLSSSELRYRRLFESAKDGILLLDADKGTVYDVNPSLIEMLGYSREYMIGKKLWEISPVKGIETAKSAFKELLEKEQARYENLPLETGDGRIVEVEVVSSVYKVNQTRVAQCNFRDITERKALEKLKADFYAMVTHDIRSPITSVLGYADILMSTGKLDAETYEMVASIIKSVEKIENLIENFLSISKVEAGKLVINPAPTDIAALLRDACSEIEIAVRKKKLDLQMEIDDGLPKAMVDSKLIQRAVLNLLQNAVNYTPTPGIITLKAVFEGNDFIIISVMDTGKGVPADERQAIFEKYYRAEKTAGVKGSGLGLAIAKAIAEAHGGRVEVESEVGKGSTFKFFIPVNAKMKEPAGGGIRGVAW